LRRAEDHIVPWRAAYRSLGLLGGDKKFVLGASGHIAGIVNPAAGGKRSFWFSENHSENPTTGSRRRKKSAAAGGRSGHGGFEPFKGGARNAPAQTGSAQYPAIEPAPGRYVKQKAN